MNNENKYIDELFKESFAHLKVDSTKNDDLHIGKTISKFNFFHFGISSFNIYYFFALLLVIGLFSFHLFNKNNQIISKSESIEDFNTDIKTRNIIETAKAPVFVEISEEPDITEEPVEIVKSLYTNEIDESVNEIILPVDSVNNIEKSTGINDTVYVTKKIIIVDTVRTIIHKEVKPKRISRKDAKN